MCLQGIIEYSGNAHYTQYITRSGISKNRLVSLFRGNNLWFGYELTQQINIQRLLPFLILSVNVIKLINEDQGNQGKEYPVKISGP